MGKKSGSSPGSDRPPWFFLTRCLQVPRPASPWHAPSPEMTCAPQWQGLCAHLPFLHSEHVRDQDPGLRLNTVQDVHRLHLISVHVVGRCQGPGAACWPARVAMPAPKPPLLLCHRCVRPMVRGVPWRSHHGRKSADHSCARLVSRVWVL